MGPETGWRQFFNVPSRRLVAYMVGLRSVLRDPPPVGCARDRAGDHQCCGVAGAGADGPRGMKLSPGPWAGLQGGTHEVLLMTSLCSRPWLVTHRWGIPTHGGHFRWLAGGRHSRAEGTHGCRGCSRLALHELHEAALSCWWLQAPQLVSFG